VNVGTVVVYGMFFKGSATVDDRDDIALQLCIAEYEAMIGKVNLWITLQFTIVSLVLLTLSILAQLWPRVELRHVLWLAAVVVGLAGVYYLNVKLDGLRAVLYTEKNLRPRAAALLRSQNVFGWERFLKRVRPPANRSESVNNPALIVTALPFAILSHQALLCAWDRWDWCAIATGVCAYAVINKTRQGDELWRKINEAADLPEPAMPQSRDSSSP